MLSKDERKYKKNLYIFFTQQKHAVFQILVFEVHFFSPFFKILT